ncbi:MAG: Demethylmenaquinone methyltransferase [candidate division WS6 bacterium OLB20]|uniref:Demethylmenaquinone methyltransferase n=1 Tax=candidate division WS6 bacterium OLB20 TaxID=1617426 RepID=A0A136LZM8_9BACT|nr:MAG: Demethylmenaquinone methyltransferase [candidate division WS6 bacterium OLB20]
MKLSRNATLKIHYLLDQFCPPVVRDSGAFIALPFRMLFGSRSRYFKEFKEKNPRYSAEDYREVYRAVDEVLIQRPTDLNTECIEAITSSLAGESVLDVGCGRGLLAGVISNTHQVTGLDMLISDEIRSLYPAVTFVEGFIEDLPFEDNAFDTVVCTHTLEHVQNLFLAISELRRVAAQRLIIVVPRQRPYRYTFDLHLHFFPYEHSLLNLIGPGYDNSCITVGGDLFYTENVTAQAQAKE